MSALIRWNPVREMSVLQNAMDRLFDETWGGMRPAVAGNTMPLDVHESKEAYTVVANIAGLSADQLNINLHEDKLTISMEIEAPVIPEATRVLLQERAFGKFARTITLPLAVDADAVTAEYKDGVLVLVLPKVPEVQPRKISVQHKGNLTAKTE
ncbi:MAG TPA: Hsp20/alpha crystallin family protein [Aggregatilineales bacterium]|nr:Hsp20/alpha crystallin family protein [Aggregatilineales bacterium]